MTSTIGNGQTLAIEVGVREAADGAVLRMATVITVALPRDESGVPVRDPARVFGSVFTSTALAPAGSARAVTPAPTGVVDGGGTDTARDSSSSGGDGGEEKTDGVGAAAAVAITICVLAVFGAGLTFRHRRRKAAARGLFGDSSSKAPRSSSVKMNMSMNAMYKTVDHDTAGPDTAVDAAPVYASALEVSDPVSSSTNAMIVSAGTTYAIPIIPVHAAHSYAQPDDSVAGTNRDVALRNDAYEGVPEGYLDVETSA